MCTRMQKLWFPTNYFVSGRNKNLACGKTWACYCSWNITSCTLPAVCNENVLFLQKKPQVNVLDYITYMALLQRGELFHGLRSFPLICSHSLETFTCGLYTFLDGMIKAESETVAVYSQQGNVCVQREAFSESSTFARHFINTPQPELYNIWLVKT